MAKTVALNPILNNPYIEPASYYATNESGELDYERIVEGRRLFIPDIPPIPVVRRREHLRGIRFGGSKDMAIEVSDPPIRGRS